MSTGLNDKNVNLDCTEDTCLQYEADAGTRWSYHNAPYTLLRDVIENATGSNINSYAFQNLMQPTGMTGSFIKLGFNNVFFSRARSMARFGLLIQNRGVWNGNSILSDTAYFNSMINTSQAMNKSYGYLWWLNGKESFMVPTLQNVFPGSLHPDAPDDMISALGKNGQILNVIPSKNMVWIRMGSNPDNENGLVSITYNNRIWQRINKLDCNLSNLQEVKDSFIQVFPNPASEYIMIKSNSQIQYIEILDLNAKVRASHQINKNSAQLDVSILPNGLYVLKCVTPQGIELKKISIFNGVHQ